MSQYTTEVRYICEDISGLTESVGRTSIDDVIDKSWEEIFGTDFPMFDEDYRETLCKKILAHYYTREIGYETVGLWIFKLRVRMNEIMPYYNQMYESALLEFNPFKDFEYTVEHEGENSGSTSGSNSGTTSDSSSSTNKYSETPQNGLSGVLNDEYLTSATVNSDTNSGSTRNSSESESSGTNKWSELFSGKRSGESYSKLLQEFRKSFVNIDLDIINSLGDLFFNLWS